MKICLNKDRLKYIIEVMEFMQQKDSSLSNTLEIEVIEQTETHNASDKVKFYAQSSYSECNSTPIGQNF